MASSKKSKEGDEKVKNNGSNLKVAKPTKHKEKRPAEKSELEQKKKKKKKNSNGGTIREPETIIVPSSSTSSEDEQKVNDKTSPRKKISTPSKRKKTDRGENDDVGEAETEEVKMCRFPMNRVRKIMKSEDPGSKITQDAVFIVNKAMEMFLEQFCGDAYEHSSPDSKKLIHYKHLSSVVGKESRYKFLSDIVPQKLKAEDALAPS